MFHKLFHKVFHKSLTTLLRLVLRLVLIQECGECCWQLAIASESDCFHLFPIPDMLGDAPIAFFQVPPLPNRSICTFVALRCASQACGVWHPLRPWKGGREREGGKKERERERERGRERKSATVFAKRDHHGRQNVSGRSNQKSILSMRP